MNAEKIIDFVIWVKDGYPVPLKTPELIGKLINKIHKKGNIPRFPNKNPHKWLYIISGSMPGKSKALLEEPITRAIQRPGYINEEKKKRTPRRLLNNLNSLLLGSLNMIGMRHVNLSPVEFDVDSSSLAVNANQAFDSLGLLISTKGIGDLLFSLKELKNMIMTSEIFSGIYEPTMLLNIQSTSTGEPKQLVVKNKESAETNILIRLKNQKNEIDTFLTKATTALKTVNRKLGGSRCTHIYIKDTEIGLNWLN